MVYSEDRRGLNLLRVELGSKTHDEYILAPGIYTKYASTWYPPKVNVLVFWRSTSARATT